MPFKIHHSVIHGFVKDARKDIAQVVKKDQLLDTKLPGVISLVKGMSVLLGKKENNQVWGRFGSDGREGPFPAAFGKCVGAQPIGDTPDAAAFLALTHLVVDQVTQQAAAEPLSTGGHILCAMYDTEAGDTAVIIAMIKQKGGVLLDENYVPVGIVEVDMSKLHQAAQIRVADFLEAAAAAAEKDPVAADNGADEDSPEVAIVAAAPVAQKAGADNDAVYLSFLSQRASRDSSAYFVTALGCVVGLSSTRATSKLFEAVDAYFNDRKEINTLRKQAKERLSEYLQGRLAAGEPATLNGVHEELIRVVPADKADYVADLQEYLNGEKFKVPEHFEVNADVVKRFSKVLLQNERISIKFDRGMLGSDANSTLFYDKDKKTLTYRNLPEEFVARLDSALKGG